MNKTTFILLITLIISYINTAYIQAQTQRVTVQGSILEKDTQFPVEQATIQLLSLPDSNYVKGISEAWNRENFHSQLSRDVFC